MTRSALTKPTSSSRLLPLTFSSLIVALPLHGARAAETAHQSPTSASSTSESDATFLVTAKRLLSTSPVQQVSKEQSATASMSAEQMADQIASSIADVTRYEPGVLVTSKGRFGQEGFNVRGLDGNRVAIDLDGLDMAERYGPTSTYLSSGRVNTDIESLSNISIVKGGDAVAGSGFGGVVNMRLKSPEDVLSPEGDDTYASVKGGYRSDSRTFFESTTLAGRRGDLESMLVLTHRKGDPAESHAGSGRSDSTSGSARSTPDTGDISNYDVLFKLQKHTDRQRVGVVAQKYRSSSERHLYSSETSTYRDYMTDDSVTRERLGLYQDVLLDTALFDEAHWRLDWQRTRTVNDSAMNYGSGANAYPRLVDRYFTQRSWQLKLDLVRHLDTAIPQQIAYGVTLKRDQYDSLNHDLNKTTGADTVGRFSPPGAATRVGFYLQDRLSLADDRGSLTPAIRFDRYRYDLHRDELTSQDYSGADGRAVTGQLGGTWNLTPSVQLFGKSGVGFRAPSYEELYYDYDSGRGYRIVANPDLKPEHSRFVEAGVRFNGALGESEVTGFYTDYRNFIETQTAVSLDTANYPLGEYTSLNLDRALIRGVEFKGRLDLHRAFGASEGWYGRMAAAYIEGKNLEQGTSIQSIPPVQAVVAAGYDAPSHRWGGELAATYVNHVSQYDAGSAQYAPSAYQLYDLTGHVKLGEHLTVRGGVFNLLDKRYWVWDDVRGLSSSYAGIERYSQPGRNVGVSAEYVF
ncbi:TonB-dependent hemoglobin/transferrin/lactoferrin family receptor [Zymobacter sp. IVIA_5232.4 C2]|uniref:TonB-dependent hemoglobin/transferrin/lactoferrin family receptor n=1 Tax=Zymobacter sp. IVIA_5232.4 C2 TaxID=3394855 RepID=UPI0039C39F8E